MVGSGRREAGSTRRQRRVGEFIRRTLGDMLIRREIPDPGFDMASITVTEVQVSPDLREATVYFLPLGGGDPEAACAALERHRGQLQRAASLKFAPHLRFAVDGSFDHSARIDRLIEGTRGG